MDSNCFCAIYLPFFFMIIKIIIEIKSSYAIQKYHIFKFQIFFYYRVQRLREPRKLRKKHFESYMTMGKSGKITGKYDIVDF